MKGWTIGIHISIMPTAVAAAASEPSSFTSTTALKQEEIGQIVSLSEKGTVCGSPQ